MRVIARKTLREFWTRRLHGDAEQPLKAWFQAASKADWASPSEIKADYRSASVVGDNRIVFNIGGNKYRLVVKVNYPYRVMYIRFIGTHDQLRCNRCKKGMTMDIKPIKNARDYRRALKAIDALMDAKLNTTEGDMLDVLTTLAEAWEAKHHAIEAPEPVHAIEFVMEQRGLSRRDLEPYIGSRARVAEILNHKRSLTLSMIRRLHDGLGISADVLIR